MANTELESLNEWLLANKLSLSIGEDKDTKYTLFSPKKYPEIDSLPKLHIANQDVPYKTTIKCLGVYVDFEISCKEHLSKIYEKVNFLPCTTQAVTKVQTGTILFIRI